MNYNIQYEVWFQSPKEMNSKLWYTCIEYDRIEKEYRGIIKEGQIGVVELYQVINGEYHIMLKEQIKEEITNENN